MTMELVMAHAKFSRRIRCSLDDAFKNLLKVDTSQWPVIVSPRSWGRTQSGVIYYQILQKFGNDSHVVVCNVPGQVNLRYIALAQHSTEELSNGKRTFSHRLLIVDSETNARNREADGPRQDVQWVLNGGEVCSFTEVDENTIDVEYDHWSECLTEAHGRELYVDWIRFVVRLEGYMSPVRMLRI